MKILLASIVVLLSSPLLSSFSFAQGIDPSQACKEINGKVIPIQNEVVLGYKTSLRNLVKRQVMVKGTLVKYMGPIKNQHGTHLHFIMALRDGVQPDNMASLIEVSHSMNGMDSPSEADLRSGPIFICGEYSTTNVNGEPKITKFTPSVTGAMIHWTHRADRQDGRLSHPHGWIAVNGKVFGNSLSPSARARD